MQFSSRSLAHGPRRQAAAIVLSFAAIAGLSARDQDSKSAQVAKELTQVLDAAKLDGVAAADPASPGTFVAALYLPGTQLLVVSAKYSAPSLLVDKISKKEYRDVYIDLSSAFVAGTKLFVQDLNADGLVAKPGGDHPPDSWEENNKSVSFDGEWKKAKMTEADYTKAFTDADERYTKLLTLLLSQAKK
jgi:hypothetical protein